MTRRDSPGHDPDPNGNLRNQQSSEQTLLPVNQIDATHHLIDAGHTIKNLEQERQVIDAELLSTFGDAELRFGVRATGGCVLKQRSRTSWDYDPEFRDAIKGLQGQAQRDARAQPLVSTYLCLTQGT